jgi:nicotinamide-nucleotide amidase
MTALLGPGGPDALAVLLVGDELLLGTVRDSNAAWLARTATAAGLRTTLVEIVPDVPERITEAVLRATGRADSVVVSGGIGPTSDDLTREALAAACGCALVRDEPAAATIEAWFARQGRNAGPAVMRMARRPECADMIANPTGTAPGIRLVLDGVAVYAVPGVPAELRAMVDAVVLPDIVGRAGLGEPTLSRTVEVALLGESAVTSLLHEVETAIAADPTADLAYLARPAHVTVRVSVRDAPQAARPRLLSYLAEVRAALGEHVVGEEGTTLAQAVVESLTERGETVATAESLTGGGVAREITTVPGSSAVLRGGVVAYAADLKVSLLGVPADLLVDPGVVSAEVAARMAIGVRAVTGADWGLATTGVAGPDAVGAHPPGEVYVAVAGPTGTVTRRLDVPGERARVRLMSAAHALNLLRLELAVRASGGGFAAGGESTMQPNR